jgi:hypothetical protein
LKQNLNRAQQRMKNGADAKRSARNSRLGS